MMWLRRATTLTPRILAPRSCVCRGRAGDEPRGVSATGSRPQWRLRRIADGARRLSHYFKLVQPVCGRIPLEAALGLVRFISESEPMEPIHPVSMDRNRDRDHACWSGRSMPRSDADHALTPIRRQFWLIGLVFTIGCAYSKSELQDRLARRVVPVEAGAGRLASPPEPKTSDRATNDTTVRLAATSQPAQTTEARADNDRSGPLPPAIEGPPRRPGSDTTPSPATSLPSDSDEATLDAIATSGKPLTLAEAVDLAFRTQPRLRAQLESIAQARGAQQIAFSTFLPIVAGRYDAGGFGLGVGGQPIPLPKGLPGFNFLPGVGAVPFGLNLGTTFELAELGSNGCSSILAVGWDSTSKNDWRATSPRSRPSAPTRR